VILGDGVFQGNAVLFNDMKVFGELFFEPRMNICLFTVTTLQFDLETITMTLLEVQRCTIGTDTAGGKDGDVG
jgi:hypothetical protein